jgi:hypothetical protein
MQQSVMLISRSEFTPQPRQRHSGLNARLTLIIVELRAAPGFIGRTLIGWSPLRCSAGAALAKCWLNCERYALASGVTAR